MKSNNEFLWWQSGVVYQIYPRSFQDSNNDGVGDLPGILQRLDYLHWLGVDAIWISPMYPSPMADFGYDISDYTDVHPVFGTLADVDRLVNECHARGMKVILDLVPNHSSSEHPWFLESRSSRTNPKRDWYIWRDPVEGGAVPNNWLAAFGGSAWEWDEHTGQYYYHAFLREQPDLNWRNPEVQNAMLAVMRFWLDRGIDGFRIDVMWHMIKDEQFRDNPPNPNYLPYMATVDQLLPLYSTDQPEVHKIVRLMRHLLDEYEDRVMIGEIYLPVQKLITYYGADRKGAHLPFNFQLLGTPWNATAISLAIVEYEKALPNNAWPNWVLGNHDNVRIASRVGAEQARVAAMLLLTLRGTPTMYYGDEIGMKDVPIPFSRIRDPQGLNMPDKNLSRDPARTPMQWVSFPGAGFSNVEPWLPLERDFAVRNVATQTEDQNSMLNFYRRLVQMRKENKALSVGEFVHVFSDHQMLAFVRYAEGHDAFFVLLNFTHRPCYLRQPQTEYTGSVVLAVSTQLEGTRLSGTIVLEGDEGLIVKLDNYPPAKRQANEIGSR